MSSLRAIAWTTAGILATLTVQATWRGSIAWLLARGDA